MRPIERDRLVPDGHVAQGMIWMYLDTRSGQVNVLQMKHNLSQVADKLERVDKLLDDVMLFLESMNLKEDDANFNDWSDLMERLIRSSLSPPRQPNLKGSKLQSGKL
jgi:hypothetical protein